MCTGNPVGICNSIPVPTRIDKTPAEITISLNSFNEMLYVVIYLYYLNQLSFEFIDTDQN